MNSTNSLKFSVGQKVSHADMNGPVFEIVKAQMHPGWPGQAPYAHYKIVDAHESYECTEENKLTRVG